MSTPTRGPASSSTSVTCSPGRPSTSPAPTAASRTSASMPSTATPKTSSPPKPSMAPSTTPDSGSSPVVAPSTRKPGTMRTTSSSTPPSSTPEATACKQSPLPHAPAEQLSAPPTLVKLTSKAERDQPPTSPAEQGIHLFVGWLFWLRQGQGNGGVQELERTVLRGGGDGEGGHGRHVRVGAVADVVAGQGGELCGEPETAVPNTR